MFLLSFLGRFWDPFWLHFGCPNRPKSGQVGSKTALGTIFVEKVQFHGNLIKTNGFSTFLTPRLVPKRPKIVPRRPQDGLEEVFLSLRFLHRFLVALGSDLGAILGRFWEPKSVIFGIDF